MLNVVFASGAVTRVPYNAGATVADLLEAVRGDEHAAEPAPGRERAYLAAAVNSATLATKDKTAPAALAATTSGADGSITEAASGSGAAAAVSSPLGPTATAADMVTALVGKAFADERPFPPRPHLIQPE